MRDNDLIGKVKKEIKQMENELQESAAQLGGVFYDTGVSLDNSTLIDELNSLEDEIPKIKSKMDELKGYNLSIEESERKIKESKDKIKELEGRMSSVLEKVGVELYCFIGDKELAHSSIADVYDMLKKGELKSETLENSLYKLENSGVKKGVGALITSPFKIRSLKNEIKQNNKDSLKQFKALGKAYCEIPQLIEEENNDSIIGILEDYSAIAMSLKSQKQSLKTLDSRISENEEKIKAGSHGVKLKTLYNKLEQEITETQNSISEKLVLLGFAVAESNGSIEDQSDIQVKLQSFLGKRDEIASKKREQSYLETRVEQSAALKEVAEMEKRIGIEEEHIKKLSEKLETYKEELSTMQEATQKRASWLDENKQDVE